MPDLSKKYQCRGQFYSAGSYGYEKKKKTLHKACWDIVSEIVRKSNIIKYGVGFCYTCGKKWHWKQMDAGHCEHAGTANLSLLDFMFDNLRPQCKHCNKYLKGNLGIYRENLKEEIGQERFDKIQEVKHQINKMLHEEYKELKRELTIKLDRLNRSLDGKL